jgi:hypothetical protein
MDSLSTCKEFLNLNKQHIFYEIIDNIVSIPPQPFYHKEEIKSEIEEAKSGCDYISACFINDSRRRGFDRRTDGSDRRTSYSLDFFSENIIERRSGEERRQEKEKRLNWTRVTKWVSVPFKAGEENLKRDAAQTELR